MVVANGLAAIEAVQQQVFDLVLMDLEMPEMGGLEATRAIRRSCPAHELPIVGVSGSNRAFLAETCTNAGMNSLLAKPLQAELIRAVLGLPQALAETA
jgi:CheY-like chemotaxis protein